MPEFVLILIKQIIKIFLSNTVFHILFYLNVKSILLSLQLADLSVTLSLTLILLMWRIWWANNASKLQVGFHAAFKGLKLIIFCASTFSALNMAKAESQSYDPVFLKNIFTHFRV